MKLADNPTWRDLGDASEHAANVRELSRYFENCGMYDRAGMLEYAAQALDYLAELEETP